MADNKKRGGYEMTKLIQGPAFHVHHDLLIDVCYDYQKRLDYINTEKPEGERPLRARLFKMIPPDRLPPTLLATWVAYRKAVDAYEKAWDAYRKAEDAYEKAGDAYEKAEDANMPALKALHAELCPDCPWDGHTIFPKEKSA